MKVTHLNYSNAVVFASLKKVLSYDFEYLSGCRAAYCMRCTV